MNWETKIKDILPDWRLSDPYASDHADLIDLLCECAAVAISRNSELKGEKAMRIGLPGHDRVLQ